MTSALLTVGVDSKSGREEVSAFKRFVQQELGSVKFDIKAVNLAPLKVQIDESSLHSSILAGLGEIHQLKIDSGSIVEQVHLALEKAFDGKVYRINIDTAYLTEQVMRAVNAGMAIKGNIQVPTTNTGIQAMTASAMAESLRQAILPLVDKIDQIAQPGGSSDTVRRRRMASISTSGVIDGVGASVRMSVAPDEALGYVDSIRAQKEKMRADQDAEKASIKLQQEEDAYRQRAIKQEDEWEAAAQRSRDEAWIQAEKQSSRDRMALVDAGYKQQEAADRASRETMERQQLESNKARKAISDQAERAALAEYRVFYEQEEAVQKESDKKAEAEAAAHAAKMREAYARAQEEAKTSYTGRGVNISAAQSLSNQFGPAATQQFLGNQDYLLKMSDGLEDYRKRQVNVASEVKEVSKSHEELSSSILKEYQATQAASSGHASLNKVLNESHSAVRGLAGSVGAMWLTWGSVVPLVAAGAIGSALREVVTVGKDVEYQLAFVSALSEGAVVDLDKFGAAVRGNLVAPKEAAEGMRALAQNGLSVADSLKVLPDVLRLATVGEMSISEAALGATGVMAAFGLQVDDLGRIGDVFARAAADSNTSVSGMVEAMKQASTVSDLYHVSLEQTASSLAVLAKYNITGTQAGTAFRNMMANIAAPTATAQKAIDALKLSFYDMQGNLKPLPDLLEEIRHKTENLQDKSKVPLLNEIFGERGLKSVNALISNLDLVHAEYDKLTNDAQGFASGVVNALSETAQGRIKTLMSDFELTATNSFASASGSVKRFIDTLDDMANSDGFKQGLTALTSNVASFANSIAGNAKDVIFWGSALLITKGSIGVVGAELAALVPALSTTAASEVAAAEAAYLVEKGFLAEGLAAQYVAASARTASIALGAATFGISVILGVIVPLIANWLLFKNHTDELTTAVDNDTAALKRHGQQLDEETSRLSVNNGLLIERVRLMAQGLSYTEAQTQAEKNLAGAKTGNNRNDLANRVAQTQGNYDSLYNAASPAERISGNGRLQQAASDLAAAKKNLTDFDDQVNRTKFNAEQTAADRVLSLNTDLRHQIEDFNKTFAEFRRTHPNYKGGDLSIPSQTELTTNDALKSKLNDANQQFDSLKDNVQVPKRDHALEQLEHKQTEGLIQEIKRRESELKAYYDFRRTLEEEVFKDSQNNAIIKSKVQQEYLKQESAQALQEHQDAVSALEDEKKKYRGKEGASERQNIDNVIAGLNSQYDALVRVLAEKKLIADMNARDAVRKDDDAFNKTLAGMAGNNRKLVSDMQVKANNQLQSPRDAAYDSAYQATVDANSNKITDQSEKLKQAKAALNDVNDKMQEMVDSGQALDDSYLKLRDNDQAMVTLEQQRLDIMTQQSTTAARKAGEVSQQLYDRSQTAGAGWDKFWSEWSANATSNAKMVEDVLNTTFQGAENSLASFVTTGKLNFRSLVSTILAEAARMAASRLFTQLVSVGISMFGGMGSGDYTGAGNTGSGFGNAGAGDYSNAGLSSAFGHQGGGQTLSNQLYQVNEDAPELYDYDGKQYLMAGSKGGQVTPMEHSYEPAMRSTETTSNQGPSQVHMTTSVVVHADGTAKVGTDASGTEANRLAGVVNEAIRQTLVNEQRPGGILYGTRNK